MMNLRHLLSDTMIQWRNRPSADQRRRRAANRVRPTMFEALEERALMAVAIFNNETYQTAGNNFGYPFVSTPYLTATKPNFDAMDSSLISTTVTNAAGSGHTVKLGVAIYADREGHDVKLENEILVGIAYAQTLNPGESVKLSAKVMHCMQFDVFVNMVDGNTVQKVVTDLAGNPNGNPVGPGYSNYPTSTYSTLLAFANTSGPNGLGSDCDGTNPLSQGYWKNHTDAWNLPAINVGQGLKYGLSLGDQFYTKDQLSTLISTPPSGGNATLILDKQLIAAKLNILAGNPAPLNVIGAIKNADSLLVSANIPNQISGTSFNAAAFVKTNTVVGGKFNDYASTMEAWNA